MVHQAKEDALRPKAFEQLVASTYRMDKDYFELETRMILFAAGRLGMRSGEIAHMRSGWINWRRGMIHIPGQQDCTKGKDGGPCGHCKQAAKQMAEYNENVMVDEALEECWSPKTDAASRNIPLDASVRAELAIEAYFNKYDKVQCSQSVISRRVNRAAARADGVSVDDVYPHALRATAATFYASRGLEPLALQSMMGWSDFSTAHHYIQTSGEQTARAVRDTLS